MKLTYKQRQRKRRNVNSHFNRSLKEYFKTIDPTVVIKDQRGVDFGLVLHIRGFFRPLECASFYSKLSEEIVWPEERQKMPGVRVDHPRDQVFFASAGIAPYRYPGGQAMQPLVFEESMLSLKQEVTKRLKLVMVPQIDGKLGPLSQYFADDFPNAALALRYVNQNDSSGLHSDRQVDLGYDRQIVAISFGCTRILQFRHKEDRSLVAQLSVDSGDAVVMVGWLAQSDYLHELIKSKEAVESPRICLSFRQHLSASELRLVELVDQSVGKIAGNMLTAAKAMVDGVGHEKTRKSALFEMAHLQRGGSV
eukprot:TRINITY_DN1631_c0_g2_i1.p1 TRINITY_DN1631_c0_g2~~TRINITY_DN1631_c0_g2_i1.p1  ORF type:complete len:308 (+),score=46.37 TRINITY_DN1631_c0_g2_i1:194-1117(+)